MSGEAVIISPCMLVSQSSPTLYSPMTIDRQALSVHGVLQARILEGLPFSPLGDPPDRGIEPRSSVFQADPLPAEPPRKPYLPMVNGNLLNICSSPNRFQALKP